MRHLTLAAIVVTWVAVTQLAHADTPTNPATRAAPPPGPVLGERTVAHEAGGLVERDTVQIAPAAGVKVKQVTIDNRLGDVEVVGHDEPGVALTVVKRGPDGATLDRLKVNLTTDPDGTVDIGAALVAANEGRPVPARAIRIDISVEVPRGAHVEVRAWNGKVAVTGVQAGAKLSAHAADLSVTDVRGPVTTEVTRGTQHLTSVNGDVSAAGTFGELALDGISGDTLAARVHDGQLTAMRIRSHKISLRTTFGDIHFTGELMADSHVDIATYKGKVDVKLVPSGAAVRIDAETRDGAVDSRIQMASVAPAEKGRLVGSFGKGARPASLKISSIAGDVTLGMAGL